MVLELGTAATSRSHGSSADSNHLNGFATLASAPLPTLGGDSLQKPSWQRSIQELGAANMKFSSYSAAHALPSAEAQFLLGNRTDFGLLSHVGAHTTAASSGDGSTKNGSNAFSFDTLSGGGIQEVVERHRHGILERILKDQREQTQRLLDQTVERQLQHNWNLEKAWWKKHLVGDRNLMDATTGVGIRPSTFDAEGVVGVGKRGGLLMADSSSKFTASLYATGGDLKSMAEHLSVVQEIDASTDYEQLIRKFEKVSFVDEDAKLYQTSWLLLRTVLPSMRTHANEALGAARGVQIHFCRQYQLYISSQVKSASLNGQDVSTTVQYSSGVAGKIASFVKLVSGSNASVWEVLYYCKYMCQLSSLFYACGC
jgi:hypothetical protein